MRIRVDPTKCAAFGICVNAAPDSFSLNEWGYSRAAERDISDPTEVAQVNDAIAKCPERAIRIIQ